MNPRRFTHVIALLVAALLFSAAAPCGLFEVGEAPVCTTQDAQLPGDQDHGGDGDCCDACLTCCPNITAPHAASLRVHSAAAPVHAMPAGQGPPGAPLPVWRPPRR